MLVFVHCDLIFLNKNVKCVIYRFMVNDSNIIKKLNLYIQAYIFLH